MACGCSSASACSCDFVQGPGITIGRMGDTIVISGTVQPAPIQSVISASCIGLAIEDEVLIPSLILADAQNAAVQLACTEDGLVATVTIDPASTAAVSVTEDGLRVDSVVASDTNSVNLSQSGAVLSADVILDPASTAPVSITSDGLRVDCCDDAYLIELIEDAQATADEALIEANEAILDAAAAQGDAAVAVADAAAALAAAQPYVHNQGAASATWTIVHNLGRWPQVTVVDTAEQVIEGSVEYIDDDTIEITFSGSMSGRAFIGG